jgi:diacylglycerol kinase (ATP)
MNSANKHISGRILFLVNPISGGKRKHEVIVKLRKLIQQVGLDAEVHETHSREDTIQRTSSAVEARFYAVVAVGGDGTINDIASQLTQTSTALGIIPMGSGNGLSRELKIPFSLTKAFNLILENRIRKVDTGTVNGKSFFNVAGIGFDAHIAGLFEKAESRGLLGYLRLILQTYSSYKPETYKLTIQGNTIQQRAFLLAVCNGTQFGNNAWVGPNAKLDDGKLDITMINRARWFDLPGLVYWMFRKQIHRSKVVSTFQGTDIQVERVSDGLVNLDGEPIKMSTHLNFSIIADSLSVIC